ncbi:hypothetical protein E2C01_095389 [Portunus trituberculatus]|uniref:Uncharacterized protein n=1 Tax=Portunus trituberculatus TaxID=210409 RepID=A0A5B7JV47_PORTR|nr:hypothetical protein [Portunus trituberculatus]
MVTENSLEDSFDLPLSGQTTDPSHPQGTTSPYPKIAWARLTGFPGVRYCCVCSYSTRLKEVTACSQTECPNQACTDCHRDSPFCCLTTEDLRLARGIQNPVTHMLDTPEPTPHTVPDSQAALAPPAPHQSLAAAQEDIAVREELLSNSPEALVEIILNWGELYTYKSIVEAYRRHNKRFLQQRSALVETLNAVDAHALVEQQTLLPTPTTQATSALPSKTDWQEVCSTHPHW